MATDVFEPLEFERVRRDGTVVLRLNGEVDVATSPTLRAELVTLIEEEGARHIELDLAGMSFIDSTGVGVLVGMLRRLRNEGGELRLANPRPSTMRVLEIVGLVQIFDITLHGPDTAAG